MIPIWLFILVCVSFLAILIHQNNKLLESHQMHNKTWTALKEYIKKYGIDKKIMQKLESINE